MPLELISMAAGFVITAIVRLAALKMRLNQQKHETLMSKLGAERRSRKDAREYGSKDKGFSFTRRAIALAIVASVVVLPALAGWLSPELSISYGYEETKRGFMFFTDAVERVRWVSGSGIILGPVHWHLLYAIAGMYFGGSSTK
jgi:hypothetical protein